MIHCTDIEFCYDSHFGKRSAFALKCKRFEAPTHFLTFVLGSNGSGKTTFLKLLAGLLKPVRGTISLNGQPELLRSEIGWIDVRAAENLVSELTVVDHLALALVGLDKNLPLLPRTASDAYYEEKLSRIGGLQKETVKLLRERVSDLSRGQKQLLSIALAVMAERSLLLADETTANLDVRKGREFFTALTELAANNDIAVVVVTHDLLLAADFGNRFYRLTQGEVNELVVPTDRDQRIQIFEQALLGDEHGDSTV